MILHRYTEVNHIIVYLGLLQLLHSKVKKQQNLNVQGVFSNFCVERNVLLSLDCHAVIYMLSILNHHF